MFAFDSVECKKCGYGYLVAVGGSYDCPKCEPSAKDKGDE